MKPGPVLLPLALILALLLAAAGCIQPAPPALQPALPSIYIVYGSDKGDLSYTDSAYQGILAAEENLSFAVREFVPRDYETLPALLNSTPGPERPVLIITVGFQYANFTKALAEQHPEIRFLAIDQAGIASGNVRTCEITSYGDSYLAGALAATATRTGRVGIVMGMQSGVLDEFLAGYTAGARAVNTSIVVDHAYVRQHSTTGFMDPEEARRIADGMYGNGTDVIFTCAGYSNTGAFDAARITTGRYVIGTDTDQSPLGPDFVLASAVKRVDRLVYTGISERLSGTFSGGRQVAGLSSGATGIVFNPKFAQYNATVSALAEQAGKEESAYIASRSLMATR